MTIDHLLSCNTEDNMHSTISLNNTTNLSNLQTKCYIFKWFLHFSTTKIPQISCFLTTWTLWIFLGNLLKLIWIFNHLLQKHFYIRSSFFQWSCYYLVSIRIFRITTTFMFLQYVCTMYLHNNYIYIFEFMTIHIFIQTVYIMLYLQRVITL